MRTAEDYALNEREMLAVYRKLDWRHQVILIGEAEALVGRGYVKSRDNVADAPQTATTSCKVIRFPAMA